VQQQFEPCLHMVLSNMFPEPGAWEVLLPGAATWCPPGAVFTYSQSAARLSLGIMGGLSLSVELVKMIGQLNKVFVGGYFWLVDGQGDEDWQVVWATKMLWDHFQSTDFMAQWIVQGVGAAPLVLTAAQEKFGQFGGRPWWDDSLSSSAQAIVLVANAA
jgi:hypothetical protein